LPAPRLGEVTQLSAGRFAAHSVAVPEAKLTEPVASAGNPEADNVTVPPNDVEAGLAEAVIE
jgi:hypothetical protein